MITIKIEKQKWMTETEHCNMQRDLDRLIEAYSGVYDPQMLADLTGKLALGKIKDILEKTKVKNYKRKEDDPIDGDKHLVNNTVFWVFIEEQNLWDVKTDFGSLGRLNPTQFIACLYSYLPQPLPSMIGERGSKYMAIIETESGYTEIYADKVSNLKHHLKRLRKDGHDVDIVGMEEFMRFLKTEHLEYCGGVQSNKVLKAISLGDYRLLAENEG